ncbi:MAG: tetratricopeptide repeat protein [Pseudomonadota bacterium]
MAYDLEEQEQIASLQAFWTKWGNLLTWLLIIVLGSYAGYQFWNKYQRDESAKASALFDQLQESVLAKDNAKAQRAATDLQAQYKRTTYASLGALAAAKSAFVANDLKTAKTRLQFAIDNGNDEQQAVAKLRLAGVLLDEKAYDEGLKLLGTTFPPAFAGAVADRRGDILVAQNKIPEARAAYQAALDAMEKQHPGRPLVQVKFEAIGGTVPASKAAA